MRDVVNLGQVFTTPKIVSEMMALMKNKGRILEPSCGDGAFLSALNGRDVTLIEYDQRVAPTGALVMDFFDYPTTEKFSTIIGNPPYVKMKAVLPDTRAKLDFSFFDERANLYLHFIKKSIDHLEPSGELIFITPRDFLKATSSVRLNEWLYSQGTITDVIDYGDEIIFPGYNPNCIVFRFEKGNYSRKTNVTHNFSNVNGMLLFTRGSYSVPFSSLFKVKVGGVSGADNLFESKNGNIEVVCSKTRDTGTTRRMFYNIESPELLSVKDLLLQRKIKTFTEKNWYQWGRNIPNIQGKRIYVNNKTRNPKPFFTHDCEAFDGSVLALYPVNNINVEEAIAALNGVDWEELGFKCDGRFLFTQRSLENILLPKSFKKFL